MPDFSDQYLISTTIMKKYLFFSVILLLVGLCSSTTYAQQEVQFSHNMFNILSFNPGYAGSNDQICLNSIVRQQWMGFSETNPDGDTYSVAPQTYLFSIDGNLNPIRGGLGAVVYKDKLGHEDNIGFKFGYAYRRVIGSGQAGFGLMAGFLNKTINYEGFFSIDENDPLLLGSKESDMIFDLSFGAYYRVPGQWYAGISSSQLLQSESDFSSATTLASPQLKRHYFLIGGYQYTIPSAPDFELQPSLFIKTDFVSAQYDVNCLVMYQSQFWAGLSYRPVDAFVFLAGAYPFANGTSPGLESLRVGISYDFTTSAMGAQGRSNGSAEIYLGYCFKIIIPKYESSYKNVRHL